MFRDIAPWTRPFVAFLLALAVPAAATADDAAEDDGIADDGLPITVVDEVTVEEPVLYQPEAASTATKQSTPLRLLPLSISALSNELLEDRNALVLGQALDNAAGVNAQSNSGVHDLFFIRGFESLSSSLVLTDGAPEPEASFYQLYNVDRIEVVRGPAGFLYGGNPLAGAVNLVRKRPVGGSSLRFGAQVGSHSTAEGNIDVNTGRADGTRGFRVNGLWRESDGYRDDRESTVAAVNPVYAFVAGKRTAITVSAEAVRSDFTPDVGIPLLLGAIPDIPRERSYQRSDDFSEQDILRLKVDIETRFGPRFTLRNKTYFTELDWHSRSTLINGAFPTPFGTPVFRSLTELDDEQTFFGHQVDAIFTVGRHRLLAGLEVLRQRDEFTLTAGPATAIDLFTLFEFPTPGFGFALAADATTTVVAPYILDDITLGDRWHLYLGGRFDDISFEDDLIGLDESASEFSPFAGVLFAASDRLSLYANYSEAFSPPSTTTVGPDREPEEGRQVEAGIKAEGFGGKLRAALAVYALEKDQIAIVGSDGFSSRLGDQESQGVEVEVSASPRRGLDWFVSYAYTDAELTRFTEIDPLLGIFADHSGNRPIFAPEHLANFWVSRRFESGFGVAGGGRYVSEQFIDEDNAFAIDEYATFDTALFFRKPRWQATLHLRNLTDEDYEGRGFGGASVLPADGFNVLAGFEWIR